MILKTKIVNDVVEISLEGKMYVQQAFTLREEALKHIENGYRNFEFNLGALEYIDSSGLGVLIGIQKKALQNGGKVTIVNLNGDVKSLFELTRLNLVFEVK